MGPPNHSLVTAKSLTKHVHRDVYPAIDPSSPRLDQSGRIVLISGASRGIGKEGIAPSFAKANAKAIILTATKLENLNETVAIIQSINPKVEVLPLAMNMADPSSIEAAFEKVKAKFGTIDVLVNNAGIYAAEYQSISNLDIEKWWTNFEINDKGTVLVTKAFLNLIASSPPSTKPTIINISSSAGLFINPNQSGYHLSKLFIAQLNAWIAAENPNLTSIAIHPGLVHTDMTLDAFWDHSYDTPMLTGGITVWLSTDEARFLNGRWFDVNWDVPEVLALKDKIIEKDWLKLWWTGDFGTAELVV